MSPVSETDPKGDEVVTAHLEKVVRSNYGTAAEDDYLTLVELIAANKLGSDEIVELVRSGIASYRDYAFNAIHKIAEEHAKPIDESFRENLLAIQADIELGMNCQLNVEFDEETKRFYFQIECERIDTITGLMGTGYGGKAYLSPWMSDSEIIQIAFGLYKGYWEHEARETFKWRERRPFGPHIKTEALWSVAKQVDLRKPVADAKAAGHQ